MSVHRSVQMCFLFLLYFPWLFLPHGFCKHSREQYEKLSTMHKNMQKLYESIGSYFAFDPHSVSVEDFFGELANFRMLFLVSTVQTVSSVCSCSWEVHSSSETAHTCMFRCTHFLFLTVTEHPVYEQLEQTLGIKHACSLIRLSQASNPCIVIFISIHYYFYYIIIIIIIVTALVLYNIWKQDI